MCENNTIDKRPEKKSGLFSPLIAQASAAAPKVFILTPEILQNLGLSGRTGVRRTPDDAVQKIDLAAIISQATKERDVSNKNKCIIANLVPVEMPSNATDESTNRPIDGEAESFKGALDAKEKENGIKQDSISAESTSEESICNVSSKAKRGRRKSNLSNARSDRSPEASNERFVHESTNEAPVRTSKRVAKPKKFDDYIMSSSFAKAQARATATANGSRGIIEKKRQPRKLSVATNDEPSSVSESQNLITPQETIESLGTSVNPNEPSEKPKGSEEAVDAKSELEIERLAIDDSRIHETISTEITVTENDIAKLDVEATVNMEIKEVEEEEEEEGGREEQESLSTEEPPKDLDENTVNADAPPRVTSIAERSISIEENVNLEKEDDFSALLEIEKDEAAKCQTPRRRGRPRGSRRSKVLEDATRNKILEKTETQSNREAGDTEDLVSAENASRTKKPPPRNEDETDGKGLSEESETNEADYDTELGGNWMKRRGRRSYKRGGRGRGRGRRRGIQDSEYFPRIVSSDRTKRDANKSENNTADQRHSLDVDCGKCEQRMPKKEWLKHNMAEHNGMGWLAGETQPDFERDIKHLRSVLTATLKRKKGTLKCETCKAEKRSVNGFVSHLQFCGKTEEEKQALMMTCPVCKAVMMPSSMEMHERFHRQMEEQDEKKKLATNGNENQLGSSGESGRGKRKAAQKAATKISEFTGLVKEDTAGESPPKKRRRCDIELQVNLIKKSQRSERPPNVWKGIWKNELARDGRAVCRHGRCDFSATSIEQLCDHYSVCEFRPQLTFTCKICEFSSGVEETVARHIEEKHPNAQGETNDPDFESDTSSSFSDSDSDYSDSDKPQKAPKCSQVGYRSVYHKTQMAQPTNIKFLDDEPPLDSRLPVAFAPALRWTMEFERKNYRLRLFDDFVPNRMIRLEYEESLKYIPKVERSMRVKQAKAKEAVGKGKDDWKYWERFEGTVYKGVPTFFAGGPVWAVAWLPIPAPMYNRAVDQYVAVSTHPSMDIEYTVGKPYDGKGLIQLWNLGHLDHGNNDQLQDPVLSYCIAHDSGTIWSMEWCPSGCYQHSDLVDKDRIEDERDRRNSDRERMGLLAAGCSDGCVHIFSLPFPSGGPDFTKESRRNQRNSQCPIYRTKPVVTLVINTLMYERGEQTWQCVKINWTRESGHDIIICGFSNGYVALWDLKSKSPLFVTKRDDSGDTIFVEAFHHFHAHGHAVTGAQLIPYGGKRFFLTASYDRWTKLWDLEDTASPITAIKRGLATDAAWMTHWPSFLTSYDDVYGLGHTHTYLISLRQPGHRILPMLPTNSPIFNIAVSDYGNSVAHGTSAGEVLVAFHHHLWNPKDMDRELPRKRWLASSIEVVDFEEVEEVEEIANRDPDESNATTTKKMKQKRKQKRKKEEEEEQNENNYVYLPDTYDACKDRFRIVFRDTLVRTKHNTRKDGRWKPPSSEKLTAVQVEQYPFASVNRVSWNPNPWSYLWFCVAYQNGLIRFLNFNTMSLDKELQKLLPPHAKSMLATSREQFRSNDATLNTSES